MGKFLYLGRMGGVDAPTKMKKLRELSKELNIPWREVRHHYKYPFGYVWSPYNPWTDKNCRWVEYTSRAGLRFVNYADGILRLNHTGWYTDSFQDETLRGAVWQLPGRNGKPVYVHGYEDSMNKGAAFICFDTTDEERDAALMADSMAENSAARAREDNEKEEADIRVYEIKEELKKIRSDILQFCKQAKEACKSLEGYPLIIQACKEKVRRLLDDREELFEEKSKLEEILG